jgi:hypothetical protein
MDAVDVEKWFAPLRELFAELCHAQWSGWMRYLFSNSTENPDGSVTIPVWAVERWKRQIATPYTELSEAEKNSDRTEANKFIELLQAHARARQ